MIIVEILSVFSIFLWFLSSFFVSVMNANFFSMFGLFGGLLSMFFPARENIFFSFFPNLLFELFLIPRQFFLFFSFFLSFSRVIFSIVFLCFERSILNNLVIKFFGFDTEINIISILPNIFVMIASLCTSFLLIIQKFFFKKHQIHSNSVESSNNENLPSKIEEKSQLNSHEITIKNQKKRVSSIYLMFMIIILSCVCIFHVSMTSMMIYIMMTILVAIYLFFKKENSFIVQIFSIFLNGLLGVFILFIHLSRFDMFPHCGFSSVFGLIDLRGVFKFNTSQWNVYIFYLLIFFTFFSNSLFMNIKFVRKRSNIMDDGLKNQNINEEVVTLEDNEKDSNDYFLDSPTKRNLLIILRGFLRFGICFYPLFHSISFYSTISSLFFVIFFLCLVSLLVFRSKMFNFLVFCCIFSSVLNGIIAYLFGSIFLNFGSDVDLTNYTFFLQIGVIATAPPYHSLFFLSNLIIVLLCVFHIKISNTLNFSFKSFQTKKSKEKNETIVVDVTKEEEYEEEKIILEDDEKKKIKKDNLRINFFVNWLIRTGQWIVSISKNVSGVFVRRSYVLFLILAYFCVLFSHSDIFHFGTLALLLVCAVIPKTFFFVIFSFYSTFVVLFVYIFNVWRVSFQHLISETSEKIIESVGFVPFNSGFFSVWKSLFLDVLLVILCVFQWTLSIGALSQSHINNKRISSLFGINLEKDLKKDENQKIEAPNEKKPIIGNAIFTFFEKLIIWLNESGLWMITTLVLIILVVAFQKSATYIGLFFVFLLLSFVTFFLLFPNRVEFLRIVWLLLTLYSFVVMFFFYWFQFGFISDAYSSLEKSSKVVGNYFSTELIGIPDFPSLKTLHFFFYSMITISSLLHFLHFKSNQIDDRFMGWFGKITCYIKKVCVWHGPKIIFFIFFSSSVLVKSPINFIFFMFAIIFCPFPAVWESPIFWCTFLFYSEIVTIIQFVFQFPILKDFLDCHPPTSSIFGNMGNLCKWLEWIGIYSSKYLVIESIGSPLLIVICCFYQRVYLSEWKKNLFNPQIDSETNEKSQPKKKKILSFSIIDKIFEIFGFEISVFSLLISGLCLKSTIWGLCFCILFFVCLITGRTKVSGVGICVVWSFVVLCFGFILVVFYIFNLGAFPVYDYYENPPFFYFSNDLYASHPYTIIFKYIVLKFENFPNLLSFSGNSVFFSCYFCFFFLVLHLRNVFSSFSKTHITVNVASEIKKKQKERKQTEISVEYSKIFPNPAPVGKSNISNDSENPFITTSTKSLSFTSFLLRIWNFVKYDIFGMLPIACFFFDATFSSFIHNTNVIRILEALMALVFLIECKNIVWYPRLWSFWTIFMMLFLIFRLIMEALTVFNVVDMLGTISKIVFSVIGIIPLPTFAFDVELVFMFLSFFAVYFQSTIVESEEYLLFTNSEKYKLENISNLQKNTTTFRSQKILAKFIADVRKEKLKESLVSQVSSLNMEQLRDSSNLIEFKSNFVKALSASESSESLSFVLGNALSLIKNDDVAKSRILLYDKEFMKEILARAKSSSNLSPVNFSSISSPSSSFPLFSGSSFNKNDYIQISDGNITPQTIVQIETSPKDKIEEKKEDTKIEKMDPTVVDNEMPMKKDEKDDVTQISQGVNTNCEIVKIENEEEKEKLIENKIEKKKDDPMTLFEKETSKSLKEKIFFIFQFVLILICKGAIISLGFSTKLLIIIRKSILSPFISFPGEIFDSQKIEEKPDSQSSKNIEKQENKKDSKLEKEKILKNMKENFENFSNESRNLGNSSILFFQSETHVFVIILGCLYASVCPSFGSLFTLFLLLCFPISSNFIMKSIQLYCIVCTIIFLILSLVFFFVTDRSLIENPLSIDFFSVLGWGNPIVMFLNTMFLFFLVLLIEMHIKIRFRCGDISETAFLNIKFNQNEKLSKKLFSLILNLFERSKKYFKSSVNSETKVGKDFLFVSLSLYAGIAVFLIIFFPNVTGIFTSNDLTESFSSNSLSFLFVCALFLLVLIIILDFSIFESRSLKLKFAFQFCFTLIFIFTYLGFFFYLKFNSNSSAYLQIFSFFVFFLMFISGSQLRWGFPSETIVDRFCDVQSPHIVVYYSWLLFRAIPYLFEAIYTLQWSLKKTALDYSQFLKLEDIKAELFRAKCRKALYNPERKVGTRIPILEKFTSGVVILVAIIAVLFFPLFYFSSGNYLSFTYNEVYSLRASLGVNAFSTFFMDFNDVGTQGVYKTIVNWNTWIKGEKKTNSGFKYYDNQLSIQRFNMSWYSQMIWDISAPSKRELETNLGDPKIEHFLYLKVEVNRMGPKNSENVVMNKKIYLDSNQSDCLMNEIKSTAKDHSNSFVECKIDHMYNPFLFNLGSKLVSNSKDDGYDEPIPLKYYPSCKLKLINNTFDSSQSLPYWIITCDRLTFDNITLYDQPMFFDLQSTQISSSTNTNVVFSYFSSLGIVAFYTTIVLTIGTALRNASAGFVFRIFVEDIQDTTLLLRLVSLIKIAQQSKAYVLEEKLYHQLIAIFSKTDLIFHWGKPLLKSQNKEINENKNEN